jgi:hypothetical protein
MKRKRVKKKRGGKIKLKRNLKKKRSWQSCLLVIQMTPDDHDNTTRENDGTLDVE